MSTYETMRHFADSWGMLAMLIFFAGCVAFMFVPGAKKRADEAAQIPFRED
ncbi:cbb3-type cytochrome c oxidase subunit 3 [Rhizobium sp. KVB221]|uniref:Cbb3-type cytochrome c oxidase subunit 3 n=1 Tax=Rhizobium setariae TaxID=2801340 RepID=A0A936YRF3_9HYPH|nr:cbb3-type cytochrome c oxidase subunit 3 [Rhizobium setariae]MBL0373211.1 cbb3-type cytochrome c oxidase subunit 3 [Rhizobium setariae]